MLHAEQFCISTVYIIRMSFSALNNFIIVVTVVVLRVCVCLFVVFLPPRASRPRCTCSPRHRKLFRMPLTSYSGATKYGYQQNPRNVGMTLLFAVLTKNDLFKSYSTFVYLLRKHILNINTCTYTTSAHGHELSGCVCADAYNLILIFASYYYVSCPGPVYIYCV